VKLINLMDFFFFFFFKIDGIYVDLLENVEAYTGFNGDSAKKIWSSIYNENCFLNEESPLEESCTEKKVFFKLISGIFLSNSLFFIYYFIIIFNSFFIFLFFNSFFFFFLSKGMHASISAHLSSRYYDQDTKSWVFTF